MERFRKALRKIFVPALICCAKHVEKDQDNFEDVDINLRRKTWAEQRDFINKLMDECFAMADNITKEMRMKEFSPFDAKFAKFWFQIRVENCKSVWRPGACPLNWQKFQDAENIAPLMMKCLDCSSASSVREWYGLANYVTKQYSEFKQLRPC